jgi:quercetin dioxygenase-like cupin family protein
MKLTSFQNQANGKSRFQEVNVPLSLERQDEFGHTLKLSAAYVSPAVQFVELPAGMDQDWHTAPARQLVVVLSGEIEVESGDGETRRWRAGEAFVPADVSGQGHRTRCIGGAVRLLFAPLPDGFAFEGM